MFNFLINLFNQASPCELLGTITLSYLIFEYIYSTKKILSFENLSQSINEDITTFTFFYDLPHVTDNFYYDNLIFYNVMLGRSLERRVLQKFENYRFTNNYDWVKYKPQINYELLNTHNFLYSYPNYFETYMHLKYYLIYHELEFIRLKMNPQSHHWYFKDHIGDIFWRPSLQTTNLNWVTDAAETQINILNYVYLLNIQNLWFLFLITFFLFFLQNWTRFKRFKS